MGRFIEGEDRRQVALLPECLDDYVGEDSSVRVIDVFVDELDLAALGFDRVRAASTGRPGYHSGAMLKLYLYGYLNQVQSSRRLEREAGRNTELMWLLGKLAPDFKTIADFRRDNGEALRAACAAFVAICRGVGLLTGGVVAVDGSRFKAVNTRDKSYTPGAVRRRIEQAEASIERYLEALDAADRQEGDEAQLRGDRLKDRLDALRRQVRDLKAKAATGTDALTVLADRGYFSGPEILACEQAGATPYVPKPLTSGAKADGRFGKQDFVYDPAQDAYRCPAGETLSRRMTTVENGQTLHRYWNPSACKSCALKSQCTPAKERRVTRWEHEAVIEAMQRRLDRQPKAMRIRRQTVEHVFGTLKAWMGATHFKTRGMDNVAAEMSLHVLAYNLKRAIAVVGAQPLIAAMRA